jgi:SAM-dependent methyltransferase
MHLPEPLRGILRGRGVPIAGPVARNPESPRARADSTSTRASRGLEEFCASIRDLCGLNILDLGGVTQQNVSFITNLGHRLYSEDFLRMLGETFGPGDAGSQSNSGQIDFFLRQTLDYPEANFDGVLIWDTLEYLSPALLAAVVARLRRIVRPKGCMLAFFHSDDRLETVPVYTFRIQDAKTLELRQHGARRPAQRYNNRGLEKLFGEFDSVKFFLTRERLREVIVKT